MVFFFCFFFIYPNATATCKLKQGVQVILYVLFEKMYDTYPFGRQAATLISSLAAVHAASGTSYGQRLTETDTAALAGVKQFEEFLPFLSPSA